MYYSMCYSMYYSMYYSILGVSGRDHVSNGLLHEGARTRPHTEMIRERRLRYVGHVARYPAHRWVRIVLNAEIGSYTGNSAKKKWLKTVRGDLRGLNARWEDCLDRQKWKDICSGETPIELREHRGHNRAAVGSIRFEARNRTRNR